MYKSGSSRPEPAQWLFHVFCFFCCFFVETFTVSLFLISFSLSSEFQLIIEFDHEFFTIFKSCVKLMTFFLLLFLTDHFQYDDDDLYP